MKNLTSIVSQDDILDYVRNIWKTDLFRDSHDSRGFVYRAAKRYAWLPRLFCEMSNDHLERAHFATWWGVMVLRDDYTNPIIHDLYWLHEMYHAAHMPYVPHIGKSAFDDKMQRNELEASTMSEIQVYFEMPELRALSFDHEIYADRFLNDPLMIALWAGNKDVAIETMRSTRRDVMISKNEHEMDVTERWIRRFSEQNTAHSITWSDRYLEIENKMFDLQWQSNLDRSGAADLHRKWIEREAAKDSIDNIPFRQEAELFSPFYWANKEKYTKAMNQ
jgi:hypothetical protein